MVICFKVAATTTTTRGSMTLIINAMINIAVYTALDP